MYARILSVLLAAAMSVAPIGVRPAVAQGCTYTVQSGDTVEGVAQKYQTAPFALTALNRNNGNTSFPMSGSLEAGSVIRVPCISLARTPSPIPQPKSTRIGRVTPYVGPSGACGTGSELPLWSTSRDDFAFALIWAGSSCSVFEVIDARQYGGVTFYRVGSYVVRSSDGWAPSDGPAYTVTVPQGYGSWESYLDQMGNRVYMKPGYEAQLSSAVVIGAGTVLPRVAAAVATVIGVVATVAGGFLVIMVGVSVLQAAAYPSARVYARPIARPVATAMPYSPPPPDTTQCRAACTIARASGFRRYGSLARFLGVTTFTINVTPGLVSVVDSATLDMCGAVLNTPTCRAAGYNASYSIESQDWVFTCPQ